MIPNTKPDDPPNTIRAILGGREWILTPLGGEYVESVRELIIESRPNPVEELGKIIETIPVNERSYAWQEANEALLKRGDVTKEEMLAFEKTIRGTAYKFLMAVQPCHPEIDSIEKALSLMFEFADYTEKSKQVAACKSATRPWWRRLGNWMNRKPRGQQ